MSSTILSHAGVLTDGMKWNFFVVKTVDMWTYLYRYTFHGDLEQAANEKLLRTSPRIRWTLTNTTGILAYFIAGNIPTDDKSQPIFVTPSRRPYAHDS